MSSAARVLLFQLDAQEERLAGLLRQRDIACDAVADGSAAIEHLARQTYDVFVLDVRSPAVDAESLVRFVASIARERRPVVIAVAAPNEVVSLDAEIVHIVLRQPVDAELAAGLIASCVRSFGGVRPESPDAAVVDPPPPDTRPLA